MNDTIDSPEITPHYSREQVIEAFAKFAERGASDPAELDLSDLEVIEANKIHDAWVEQEEARAEQAGTEEARLLMNLELTPVFVDAGFNDKEYLEEVANDWLSQDLWAAQVGGLSEIAAKIKLKIDEINARLGQ